MKTVLVDMDGVLADFDGAVLRKLEVDHPHIARILTRPNFYIAQDYPPEHQEVVRAITSEPMFFTSLPFVDHALEGWQRIMDLGYKPRICSSPLTSNPTSGTEKMEWLERHFVPVFGKSVVDEAIIIKDKHRVDGIALIDDRPDIRYSEEATWQHIVFDRPFNTHLSNHLRLKGWQDRDLEIILAKAEKLYRS